MELSVEMVLMTSGIVRGAAIAAFLLALVTAAPAAKRADWYPGDVIAGAPMQKRPEIPAKEPVPEVKEAPKARPLNYGTPLIRSRQEADGEVIALSNDAVTVEVRIDAQ